MPKQANYRANVLKLLFFIVLSGIFMHDFEFSTNENRKNANVTFSFFFLYSKHLSYFQGIAPYFLHSVSTNFIPQMSQIGRCMESNVRAWYSCKSVTKSHYYILVIFTTCMYAIYIYFCIILCALFSDYLRIGWVHYPHANLMSFLYHFVYFINSVKLISILLEHRSFIFFFWFYPAMLKY